MIEPKLVDPLELEVENDAEGDALSSRTACSGAFCASKQHQSIMSSIQRHIGGAIRQAKLTFCRVCSRLRRAFYKRSSTVHVPRAGSCTNEARCASRWTVREQTSQNACY